MKEKAGVSFPPFPLTIDPRALHFFLLPAFLRHKGVSAEGRANIWLFLCVSKHWAPPFYTNTSLSLCLCIISLFIRPLLVFKQLGTHASVLFVVKQQKSGECKLTTSGTATFLRSSWPSRSPWMGSKFRSSRAKLLYQFFSKKNYTQKSEAWFGSRDKRRTIRWRRCRERQRGWRRGAHSYVEN